MTPEHVKIESLIKFKHRDKFSDHAWEARGLNPSSTKISSQFSQIFDKIVDALIDAIKQNASAKKLKEILKTQLSLINSLDFDTEEKEFICDLFHELAQIAGLNFSDNLNRWLYGSALSTLIKIQGVFHSRKPLETISQPCSNCGSVLKTFIIERKEGIPDHSWCIVRCKRCNDYSLVNVGPNVKEYRFGNYEFIERLPRKIFKRTSRNKVRANAPL